MTVRATDTIHYPGYIDADILAPTSTRGDLIVLDHDDPLIDALVGLNRLRELEEDWDSYGSVPPSHDLLEVAESFRSLSTRMRHLGESIREQSPV